VKGIQNPAHYMYMHRVRRQNSILDPIFAPPRDLVVPYANGNETLESIFQGAAILSLKIDFPHHLQQGSHLPEQYSRVEAQFSTCLERYKVA
jgi:hypothetical protein